MRRLRQAGLTLAAFITAAGAAQATTVTLDQCTVIGVCAQVTVTTTLVSDTIDVDVVDIPGPPATGIFGLTGANRSFGFNVVDPDAGVAISNITAGFSYSGSGVNNMGGGWGDFEFIINGPGSGSAAILPLHFNVSRPTGFLSDLALYEPNDLGYVFGAHVRNNDTGASGFVAALPPADTTTGGDTTTSSTTTSSDTTTGGPIPAAPEPAELLMFGFGLAALARRLKRTRPAVRQEDAPTI